MKKCDDDCEPICDFCFHIRKNKKDGGESYCEILDRYVSWGSYCDEYYCFRLATAPI